MSLTELVCKQGTIPAHTEEAVIASSSSIYLVLLMFITVVLKASLAVQAIFSHSYSLI